MLGTTHPRLRQRKMKQRLPAHRLHLLRPQLSIVKTHAAGCKLMLRMSAVYVWTSSLTLPFCRADTYVAVRSAASCLFVRCAAHKYPRQCDCSLPKHNRARGSEILADIQIYCLIQVNGIQITQKTCRLTVTPLFDDFFCFSDVTYITYLVVLVVKL